MINTELANVDYLLLMTKHDIQDLDYQIEIKNDYFYNINYFENNYLRKSTRIFSEHNHLFKTLVKERYHKACLIETAFYFRVLQIYLEAGPILSRYGRFFTDEFFADVIKHNKNGAVFLKSPRTAREISSFLNEIMFGYYLQDKTATPPEIDFYQYPVIRETFEYVAKSFFNDKIYVFYKSELNKFNPYHGPDGRFVSKPEGTGNSEHKPGTKPKPASSLTDTQACSDETISYIRNYDEGLFYVSQNLTEKKLCGKNVLCPDINPDICNKFRKNARRSSSNLGFRK